MQRPVEIDAVRGPQVGVIVLQADETLENDLRRLLPQELSYLVSRVPSSPAVTTESLRAMEEELTRSASLFPRGATLGAVAYACTSGAAEIGADRVAKLVQAGVATPRVTEPVSALIAACQHLGVTRLGLVTPYVAAVSAQLRRVLERAGLTTRPVTSFDEPLEENVARIAEASVMEASIEVGRSSECEAVFLSCTNLRTLGVIAKVEREIGKPVLSSNQVLAWHLCRLADVHAPALTSEDSGHS